MSKKTENTTETFPIVGKVEQAQPASDWTLDELGQYAKAQDDFCAGLGRKMAIHKFREGMALVLAHEKVGYGEWGAFLMRLGISHSSDDRARKLFERAKEERNLEGLEIMEAYERFGIGKANKAGTKPPAKSPSCSTPLSQDNPKVGEPAKPDVQRAENVRRLVEEFVSQVLSTVHRFPQESKEIDVAFALIDLAMQKLSKIEKAEAKEESA